MSCYAFACQVRANETPTYQLQKQSGWGGARPLHLVGTTKFKRERFREEATSPGRSECV